MTAEKLTSPLKYRHTALVSFVGSFPVDALRYDRCYPLEEKDSLSIEKSLNFGEPSEHLFVFVCKYSESAKPPWFESFWNGQSRLDLYVVDGYRVPEIKRMIEEKTTLAMVNWLDYSFQKL